MTLEARLFSGSVHIPAGQGIQLSVVDKEF